METKTGSLGDAVRTDSGDDAISRQVIEAVADAKGVDPLELPPLFEAVDPDALDSFFGADGSGASITSLRFEVAGCDVSIGGSGDVVVVVRSGADVDTAEARAPDTAGERCGIDVGGDVRTNTHYD